jgi:hypothetical protein
MPLAARLLLAGLLGVFLALSPAAARASCFDPVRVGDVVSFVDFDRLRRFDLTTGSWLPALPLGDYREKVRFHGDTIWAKRYGSLEALDALGTVRFGLPPELHVGDFDVRDGHVFVLVHDPARGQQFLRTYDAETGAFEAETGPTVHSGVIAAPGRAVLHTFTQFDAATYDGDGQLGEVAAVYPSDTFRGHGFRLASDGTRIVTDPATFDAATLGDAEGYDGTVPTVWGERMVTVAPSSFGRGLRLYDADRTWVGQRNLGINGTISGLFPSGDSLWVLRCGPPTFGRVELAEFTAPPALPAPLPAAGLDSSAHSYATSEEGVLYFLVWGEPHVRRWVPEENRFLDSIPLSEEALHVTRAPGGGVFVTHESGRVGRIARDGESEIHFAWVPRDFSDGLDPPIAAGPWTVFTDGLRWHAYSADGQWRSVHYESQRNHGAAWDEARSRLVWVTYPAGETRTVGIDEDGGLSAGASGPSELRYPLDSSGDRLYAGFWIADLETLEPVAELGIDLYAGRRGLWVSSDHLVTVDGYAGGMTHWNEWTAGGAPRVGAVTLPGEHIALLPFDPEHVVLVRGFRDDEYRLEFRLVATGGDLDSDGVANDEDDYPIDPDHHSDRDGDGVADGLDAFPDDPAETSDADGDGLGDVADHLPELGALRIARLSGEDWVGIAGLGRSDRDVEGQLHVFADGRYAFCTARETCLGGAWQTLRRDKGIGLTVAAEFLAGFGQSIQAGLARDLDRKVSFRFLAKRARGNVRTSAQGAVRLTLRAPHRGFVAGFGAFTGAYRIRVEGEWLELGTP